MRLPVVVVASVLASACYVTEKPVVQACRTEGDAGPAPSEGALHVLPSEVSGVALDSASWQVRGGSPDGGPVEYLILSATLRSRRTVPDQEVAVVYDAPGPHANIDEMLFEKNVEGRTRGPNEPLLVAGGHITVEMARTVRSGDVIGPHSALSYCPRTARVVPRKALALALAPDLRTPEGQAARLHSAKSTGPLVVMMDSVLKDGTIDGFVVGAALNTTDSTLKDMVVGLVVRRDTTVQEGSSRRSVDTLEYFVGDVAPHAVAPFSAGTLSYDERVIARVAYHSTDVHGRQIASGDANHASQAHRDGAR